MYGLTRMSSTFKQPVEHQAVGRPNVDKGTGKERSSSLRWAPPLFQNGDEKKVASNECLNDDTAAFGDATCAKHEIIYVLGLSKGFARKNCCL